MNVSHILSESRFFLQIICLCLSEIKSKLCAIAKLICFLVILHCYTDGNLRTCKLLLIKLLIDNNFYPCILNDPHVLRGYLCVSELVKEIIEGVRYFIDSQKN